MLFSLSDIAACGNHKTKEKTVSGCKLSKNTDKCLSKASDGESKLKCCSNKSDSKACCSNGTCEGNCSDSGCNCPGHCSHITTFACNFSNSYLIINLAEEGKNKPSFYFQEEKMSEVYFSIWTPPNINC